MLQDFALKCCVREISWALKRKEYKQNLRLVVTQMVAEIQAFEVLQGNFVLFLVDVLIYPILDFSYLFLCFKT